MISSSVRAHSKFSAPRVWAAALLSVVLSGTATAQNQSLKIGFVDFDRVVKESQYIRQVITGVRSDINQMQEEIDLNTGKYERLARLLRDQQSALSDTEIESRRAELKVLRENIELKQFEIEKALRDSRTDAIDPALKEGMDILTQIAKDEEFDMVLNGESVLYAVKTLDLTPRIIEELDKKVDRKTTGPQKEPILMQ